MAEHAVAEATTTETAVATPAEPLFSRDELARFDKDDVAAGRFLGKMLTLFFLYTIVAMSLIAWWTWGAMGN